MLHCPPNEPLPCPGQPTCFNSLSHHAFPFPFPFPFRSSSDLKKFHWVSAARRRRLHVASICINYVKFIRTTKGTSKGRQQEQQLKKERMFYKKQILYNNFVLMHDPKDTLLKVLERDRERERGK